MKTIKKVSALAKHGFIHPDKIAEIEKVAQQFSVSITPQMATLLSNDVLDNPINLQFVPDPQELIFHPHELTDPIGDIARTTVKGIVHRYPDRCLLKPVNVCAVYCRFCFRREQLNTDKKILTDEEFKKAFEYIRSKPEVWEVILTGGDPLILTPKKLSFILSTLNDIPHVEVIRIHTRIPVVESKRINTEMLKALKTKKALFIVLHANHPKELTPEALEACARIINAGIPMLSQSVLLKGINDNPETMKQLLRCFVKNRIKPYYLHHADLTKGTSHFRTSLETGRKLMKELRGDISGLCQPTYVLDIPGGYGKAPLSPCYIHGDKQDEKNHYLLEDYQGNLHSYTEDLESD